MYQKYLFTFYFPGDRSVSFDDFMDVLNDVISTQHFSEEELIDAFKGTNNLLELQM